MIDHAKLNNEAKFLFNAAYNKAVFDIESKTRNEVAIQHGVDKLNLLFNLAGYGKQIEDEEARKQLAIIINRGLGTIPLFGADTAIHKARDACGSEGFLPRFGYVQRYIDEARDTLVAEWKKIRDERWF